MRFRPLGILGPEPFAFVGGIAGSDAFPVGCWMTLVAAIMA